MLRLEEEFRIEEKDGNAETQYSGDCVMGVRNPHNRTNDLLHDKLAGLDRMEHPGPAPRGRVNRHRHKLDRNRSTNRHAHASTSTKNKRVDWSNVGRGM